MNIKILSQNKHLYSTRRLIEAGIKRGHTMEVIDHVKCNLLVKKGNPKIFYKNGYLKNVDAIIPRIGASVTFYGTAVVRQFETMGVFTTTQSDALMRSRDKLRSLQILSQLGVGLPRTIFANYSHDIDGIIKAVGGAPLVVKLLEGTQGLGVVLAESHNAAKSIIEAFDGMQARVIVQEYIKEAEGADIRAFIVDGKVVGAMKRQARSGEFRSNLHRGGKATLIKLTAKEEETAIKATQAMGLGIAGVDMLQSKRGPLILEINASPGLEGIEGATKVDIADAIIEYVEKNI